LLNKNLFFEVIRSFLLVFCCFLDVILLGAQAGAADAGAERVKRFYRAGAAHNFPLRFI
jgi:hypothetical protein